MLELDRIAIRMKVSQLFGHTVKTTPTDLSAVSHKLLYQAGYIRDISAGRYAFLPLGIRVHQAVEALIELEMTKLGSQKVLTPTLHPIELWQATNRDKAFGAEMLIVNDHHGAQFAIGATAEGMMVELVKKFNPSYRDLPIRIHQFSQKFRDEKRPRGGLLRLREFIMKDAYSFDVSEEKAIETYWEFFHAYERIFAQVGLEAIPVEADSGAIGGDFNHEFIVPADVGESAAFRCNKCDYCAHEDRAEFVRDLVNQNEEIKPLEQIEQPAWVKTMDDNVKHYQLPANRFLKNVVYVDGHGRIIIVALRGDLSANPAKIKKLLKIDELHDATEQDLAKINTQSGYVHSWGHAGAIYVGDTSLKTVRNFIGGQKEDATDTINVNYERDFTCDYTGDVALAHQAVQCPKCDGQLETFRGIEVAHTFKLDRFYSAPMHGNFINNNGSEQPFWMGSYGIGIGRMIATLVEDNHDEKGIVWPISVAPYQVYLISLGQSEAVQARAAALYDQMLTSGIAVLWDDRDTVSAGEKFADADLLGIPVRVVISDKTEAKGQLETKSRSSSEIVMVDYEQIIDQTRQLLSIPA